MQSPCASYPSIYPYWLNISSVQTGENTFTAEAKLLLSLVETGEPEITPFHREDCAAGVIPRAPTALWALIQDTYFECCITELSRRYFKQLPLLYNTVGSSCKHSESSAFPRKLRESHLKQRRRAMKYLSASWQLELSQGISQQHHPFSLSPIPPTFYLQQSLYTSAWPCSLTVNPSLWCHLHGTGWRGEAQNSPEAAWPRN